MKGHLRSAATSNCGMHPTRLNAPFTLVEACGRVMPSVRRLVELIRFHGGPSSQTERNVFSPRWRVAGAGNWRTGNDVWACETLCALLCCSQESVIAAGR